MAYLRDKEPKSLIQAARMKVINSIVDTLLLDKNNIGKEYIGGFTRYVKKAVSLTHSVTTHDLLKLREQIAGRVISIQPAYFATCIPRYGGETRAKCADLGNINPQNAKPAFCLSCTNALITNGNIKGIWMTIQPFVKESLNEDVMGFMVESHLPALRSAHNRIKDLHSTENTVSVNKILALIKGAIESIEEKLKSEEAFYER